LTDIPNIFSDNRALCKFDVSNNKIRAQGGKALATALKGNQVMTELNISENELGWKGFRDPDMSGVIALVDAIPDMGAISKFAFSGDSYDSKPVTMETSMVEADFREKGLGESGAIIAAAFLPKCT
jgi:hypothetical protein